ncbi:MAG: NINE protein [Firmicutes bacterium]|nr:NINE protein [Bacillota bacterium]
MFCRNCGKELGGQFCAGCGTVAGSLPNEQVNQANYMAGQGYMAQPKGKSKVAAGLLALLLGYGIHNFYLGYIGKAVAQLMLYIGVFITVMVGTVFMIVGSIHLEIYNEFSAMFVAGIALMGIGVVLSLAVGIWGFIEGIMILCGAIKVDGKGRPLS